jgi:phage-related protein
MMMGYDKDSFFLEDLVRENVVNDESDVAKLVSRIDRLADTGRIHNKRQVNFLGDGLFEIKSYGGLRVTWFWSGTRSIICGHCFVKKSQKTPKNQIKTAKDRMQAYKAAAETHDVVEIF